MKRFTQRLALAIGALIGIGALMLALSGQDVGPRISTMAPTSAHRLSDNRPAARQIGAAPARRRVGPSPNTAPAATRWLITPDDPMVVPSGGTPDTFEGRGIDEAPEPPAKPEPRRSTVTRGFDAVEEQWQSQASDASWAGVRAELITRLINPSDATLGDVDCRTTVCRMEMDISDSISFRERPGIPGLDAAEAEELGGEITVRLSGTQLVIFVGLEPPPSDTRDPGPKNG